MWNVLWTHQFQYFNKKVQLPIIFLDHVANCFFIMEEEENVYRHYRKFWTICHEQRLI